MCAVRTTAATGTKINKWVVIKILCFSVPYVICQHSIPFGLVTQWRSFFFNPVHKNTVGEKYREMYDSEECPSEKIHFRLIESSE